jgi:uncharacterized surface protein with fasciclin (FAS1) repeats
LQATSKEIVDDDIRHATTVQGRSVRIALASEVSVDNAKVIQPDILASNGVIHVIDTVIPPN